MNPSLRHKGTVASDAFPKPATLSFSTSNKQHASQIDTAHQKAAMNPINPTVEIRHYTPSDIPIPLLAASEGWPLTRSTSPEVKVSLWSSLAICRKGTRSLAARAHTFDAFRT